MRLPVLCLYSSNNMVLTLAVSDVCSMATNKGKLGIDHDFVSKDNREVPDWNFSNMEMIRAVISI